MKTTYLYIVLLLVGAISAVMYVNYTKSPRYSLLQIQKAVKEHDTHAFEKLVDMDAVTSGLIDDLLELYGKGNEGFEVKGDFGAEIGKGLVQIVKPQLTKLAKQELLKYIEVGSSEKPNYGSVAAKSSSSPEVLKRSGASGSQLKGIKYVKKEGKIAYVGLDMYHQAYGAHVTLDIKMRDCGDYWQVIGLSNFKQYLKEMDNLETKRVNTLNAPVQQAMNQCLNSEDFIYEKLSDEFGISRTIKFTLAMKNVGKKEIDEYKVTVRCLNADDSFLKNFEFICKTNLLPGQVGLGTSKVDINPFIENDMLLYRTPHQNLKMKGEIEYVKFADGTELRLLKKFD